MRLVGPHDPYLQLCDGELLIADEARRKILWPVLGRPGAIVADGEVAGTWRPRASGRKLTVRIDPWGPLLPGSSRWSRSRPSTSPFTAARCWVRSPSSSGPLRRTERIEQRRRPPVPTVGRLAPGALSASGHNARHGGGAGQPGRALDRCRRHGAGLGRRPHYVVQLTVLLEALRLVTGALFASRARWAPRSFQWLVRAARGTAVEQVRAGIDSCPACHHRAERAVVPEGTVADRDLPPLQPVTAIRVLPPSDEVALDACREVAHRK